MDETIQFDPVLLEVLWSRLVSITDEQAAALIRTAFTAVVSQSEDIAAGLFDTEGRMLAQSQSGTPGHINSMANAVRHFVQRYPPSELEEGDVLITNDPWISSGQLNDITVVTPVFFRDRVAAYFASTIHVIDIGGRPLGADAPDVFEEGFFIPITYLYRAGEANELLFEIIEANVRYPRQVMGDIHAQVVANDVGQNRLKETLAEFDLIDLVELSAVIRERSAARVAQVVAALPDGAYSCELELDGFDRPVHIAITIQIQGEQIAVDFTGSSPQQPYGINSVLNYAAAYAVCALKCAICPEVPNNDGIISAIPVRAPSGTLVNPIHPAPVAGRHVIGQVIPDLIYQALAPILSDQIIAGSSAVDWITQVYGETSEGKRFYTYYILAGGMGARRNKDGLNTVSFPSRPSLIPLEIIEAQSPIIFDYQRIRVDSGGPGRTRGGCGQEVQFRVRTDQPFILCPMYDRIGHRAPGLAGGQPGAVGRIETEPHIDLHPKIRTILPPETIIRLYLPGGGGFGNPRLRSREAVDADVEEGFVSPQEANRIYGADL
jgi:N-methylhydantoinase B